ncbi:IS4 family transposase, partial [Legionella pneumophila]
GSILLRHIALKSIITYKILLLSKLALTAPETDCTQILSQEEWQILYIRKHQTTQVPQKPPNIKQALIWLGKLGGFLNRKNDSLPGAMTLWRGYEELQQSIMMLRIFSGNNNYG